MEKKDKRLVIAIDGPAGSGKSTVSKKVAKSLGLLYVDTGAMYRALTLKAMRKKMDMENAGDLTKLARSTNISLSYGKAGLKVFLDGEDVSGPIRTPLLTANVKYVARVPEVRREMVKMQRAIGESLGAVLEGRDIGTVVFPDADYKFYLDADADERARRRHKELLKLGIDVTLEDVKKDVFSRDESDMKREVGALKKAPDAIFIDTTNVSVEGAVKKILSYID